MEPIGKNSFESKLAGLKFEFNGSLNGFDMTIPEGQKIPFTKDK